MTTPSHESSHEPSHDLLNGSTIARYLTLLRRSVLTAAFRRRIADRELRGEFPFSLHNIYRVLLAAAPHLYRGFSAVATANELHADDPALGTSLRCFRYMHVLLVGAQDLHDRVELDDLTPLEPIADRAVRMTVDPACFCPGGARGWTIGLDIPARGAARLATALRQYADVRWIGQHDQGYLGAPPIVDGSGRLVYVRCFGQLPPEWGHEVVEVRIAYDTTHTGLVEYDVFRGEITAPPPPAAALQAGVYSATTGEWLGERNAAILTERVLSALHAARHTPMLPKGDGDRALVDLFTTELDSLAQHARLDSANWRAQIYEQLPRVRLASGCATLTDTYLQRLQAVVDSWTVASCIGA